MLSYGGGHLRNARQVLHRYHYKIGIVSCSSVHHLGGIEWKSLFHEVEEVDLLS